MGIFTGDETTEMKQIEEKSIITKTYVDNQIQPIEILQYIYNSRKNSYSYRIRQFNVFAEKIVYETRQHYTLPRSVNYSQIAIRETTTYHLFKFEIYIKTSTYPRKAINKRVTVSMFIHIPVSNPTTLNEYMIFNDTMDLYTHSAYASLFIYISHNNKIRIQVDNLQREIEIFVIITAILKK